MLLTCEQLDAILCLQGQQYATSENTKEVNKMSEETKQVVESLNKNAEKLTPAQMQRLSDIAYGMALAKESKQEERKEA